MPSENRWIQRLSNYKKALISLRKFIDKGDLNELEEQGLIKSFEYTYELAWNIMKDYLEFQGETGIAGSRSAIKLAFNRELITEGEIWIDMVESRIKSVHTYDEAIAKEIANKIVNSYIAKFNEFEEKMTALI